ncbi:hypothetical protein ACJIZ3_011026 [Penstemon smallii]|uniref:Uncharacterized protein n=1 Tax=Penstemon smallii TaxID=265156 RepID=A0ABD3UHZ8_9LAMI
MMKDGLAMDVISNLNALLCFRNITKQSFLLPTLGRRSFLRFQTMILRNQYLMNLMIIVLLQAIPLIPFLNMYPTSMVV